MHALVLERVEGDARAQYVGAGVASALGAEGLEEYEPEQARARLEERIASTEAARRTGISDDEWELRVALGVA